MELPYNVYWILGLASIGYSNISGCPSCSSASLFFALMLGWGGYKPQGGYLLLFGFLIPTALYIILPRELWVFRVTFGLLIALLAFLGMFVFKKGKKKKD